MIIGKANSKTNLGHLVSFCINASESPLVLIRFNNGKVIKVMINK